MKQEEKQYIFTQDWFSQNIPLWTTLLEPYKDQPVNFLELGVFEGRASTWLLDNILLGRDSHLICVDTFEGSMESEIYKIDVNEAKINFFHNIKQATNNPNKVIIFQESTEEYLCTWLYDYESGKSEPYFDVIYIDASHQAKDCMLDILLSWKLLKPAGLLIIDDYDWTAYTDPKLTPKLACDTFLAMFDGDYQLIEKNHQLIVRKAVDE